jgi:hypothetical protein
VDENGKKHRVKIVQYHVEGEVSGLAESKDFRYFVLWLNNQFGYKCTKDGPFHFTESYFEEPVILEPGEEYRLEIRSQRMDVLFKMREKEDEVPPLVYKRQQYVVRGELDGLLKIAEETLAADEELGRLELHPEVLLVVNEGDEFNAPRDSQAGHEGWMIECNKAWEENR